ncbi:MAG: nucleotide-diphospho-sugar transferase [Bacteroidota bacterium]|nr:nucleotide-diphospho-sugar transferase [Bacteroidota bacterium]
MFQTPVLFLVFNRPEETQKVFAQLQKLQPSKLYLAADGARFHKEGELEKCNKVKEILSHIHWTCEVKQLYREQNLGCKVAVSEAINWFFENESEGIILEDDCLADLSFFHFCEIMLEKYRDNGQIFQICGVNFQNGIQRGQGSYYFSYLNHIWGWASWRRAWKHYDIEMKDFDKFKQNNSMAKIFELPLIQQYYLKELQKVYDNQLDTWDLQWTYSVWKHNGISIIPQVNLVTNIGFNMNATHTTGIHSTLANIPIQSFDITNIIHPNQIVIQKDADTYTYFQYFHQSKAKIWYTKSRKWLRNQLISLKIIKK